MPKPRRKRPTPTMRANQLIREVVDPSFSKSPGYESAQNYAQNAKVGRSGRAPISKPGWFNRVESDVQRYERRAFATFHSAPFTNRLNALPAPARSRVIRKYRELRHLNGQLQRISRLARTQHAQTPASLNRAHFDERVMDILQKPDRRPLSLAVIDMDFFGAVNKVFGNDVGNRVLEKFTESFKASLSQVGFHGRIGGDEFQVLGRVSPREMKKFLDDFRNRFTLSLRDPSFLREVRDLKNPRAKLSEWKPPSFTAGVAGTLHHTKKIQEAGSLFRKMDHAMQRGKRLGRERTLIISHRLAA